MNNTFSLQGSGSPTLDLYSSNNYINNKQEVVPTNTKPSPNVNNIEIEKDEVTHEVFFGENIKRVAKILFNK